MFFPAVAVALAAALGVIKNVFAFLTTPLGQIICIAAIAGTFYLAGDIHRGRVVNAAWRAADAAADQNRVLRDSEIAAQVRLQDTARSAELVNNTLTTNQKVADYAKSNPSDRCVASAADISGLRAIGHAGQPKAPSRGPLAIVRSLRDSRSPAAHQ